MSKLTPKQEAFAREYLIDLAPSAAARRAGYQGNVNRTAYTLLQDERIQALIQAQMAARAARVEVESDDVLRRLWSIASADARELMEFRRTCCRYCWGTGNRYQRTAGEMARDRAAHAQLVADAEANGRKGPGRFDQQGGIGYHGKREPNAACGECFGDGVGQAFMHDTSKLGQGAAQLYAGVKQTKEGIEIKTHDQVAALVNVGRHLGMFSDKLEHSGPKGGPIPVAVTRVEIVPLLPDDDGADPAPA